MSKTDSYFMEKALKLAEKAMKKGEVPVGAVVVCDGKIVGKGYNLRESKNSSIAHAEIVAIKKACKRLGRWRLSDCDLFVTLEPCPMCGGAIINSRLNRVVFGAYDPKAGVCGSVTNLFELPFNHKPQMVGGVLELKCSEILSNFFKELRRKKTKKKLKEGK